jgi:hypothetical protein
LFKFFDETAFLQEWFKTGAISQLVGFENNFDSGTGCNFNFILFNGIRSAQRDQNEPTKYTFMIPADALNKIRSVTIHHNGSIDGFSFFDKDGALLWKHGSTTDSRWMSVEGEKVLLEEDEVIVGVVAKLYKNYQSAYTDF